MPSLLHVKLTSLIECSSIHQNCGLVLLDVKRRENFFFRHLHLWPIKITSIVAMILILCERAFTVHKITARYRACIYNGNTILFSRENMLMRGTDTETCRVQLPLYLSASLVNSNYINFIWWFLCCLVYWVVLFWESIRTILVLLLLESENAEFPESRYD